MHAPIRYSHKWLRLQHFSSHLKHRYFSRVLSLVVSKHKQKASVPQKRNSYAPACTLLPAMKHRIRIQSYPAIRATLRILISTYVNERYCEFVDSHGAVKYFSLSEHDCVGFNRTFLMCVVDDGCDGTTNVECRRTGTSIHGETPALYKQFFIIIIPRLYHHFWLFSFSSLARRVPSLQPREDSNDIRCIMMSVNNVQFRQSSAHGYKC